MWIDTNRSVRTKIRDTADDTCVAYVHRLYFTRIAARSIMAYTLDTMSYTSDTRITRACMHARVRAWLVRLKSNDNAFHRRRRIRDAVIQAAVDGDGDALMMMVTADPCKHMCGSRDDWTDLLREALRLSKYADATTVLRVALM